MAVTVSEIKNAAIEAGVKAGDILLVHSSFKSLGEVEGGAETVIMGLLEALGEDGTLVFPTFCQKDFLNAYKTWHIDKHSDVGYLTNYFRKREGSIRSDQATHSVAACGKKAAWLTETHGHTHKRPGNMGDTPFSVDSPWEKMYNENAKILLLGVTPASITFRHYAEYVFMEQCAAKLMGHAEYDRMIARVQTHETHYDFTMVWPHVDNHWVASQLEPKGLIKRSKCGEAEFIVLEAKPFVDFVLDRLKNGNKDVIRGDKTRWTQWYNEFLEITK